MGILFSGCVSLYVPNTINAPLLRETGETRIDLNFSAGGTNLHFAHAIMDNLGILVNGQYLNREESNKNSYVKEFLGEFGLGYFPKTNGNAVVEMFAGAGFGHSESLSKNILNNDLEYYAKGSFTRLFVQADFGGRFAVFEGGIAMRLVYLDFDRITTEGLSFTPLKKATLWEPQLFLRLGGSVLKFELMAGYSFNLSEETILLQYEPFIVGIGVGVRF